MVGELKIAAFAADLRTDQQPRAVRLGEPGGIAVPLQQREAFMKNAGLDGQMTAQGFINGFGFLNGAG